MKSKTIILSLFGIIVIFCATLFSFSALNKNSHSIKEVIHTSIVLENNSFYAYVPKKYFDQEFTVSDYTGKLIEPHFEWQDNSILKMGPLATGSYTLTVTKKSNAKPKKITFDVKTIPEQAENKQQLKDYFQSIKELKAVLAAPFIANNGGLFKTTQEDRAGSEMMEASDTSTPSSNQGAMLDHSETNNQVAGIEEGDIAVTNGDYLFTVRDTDIVIVKSNPLEQIAVLPISDGHYIDKLFIYNDQLIVQYFDYTEATEKTAVQIFDVSNPQNAALVHTFTQDGYTLNSRILKDELYLLSSYSIMEENEITPSIARNGDENTIEIKDIFIYPQTMNEQYTVISKLNLTNYDVETKAFLGSSGELYMSEEAIYIAATPMQAFPFAMPESTVEMSSSQMTDRIFLPPAETTFIKYAIHGEIKKVAETTIKGTLLNQFSMDEYNGYFRAAATVGNANLNDPQRTSENILYIFDEQLNEVGKVDNLARGERIYSTRFMGDKAYIVTFVETDPLFVLNLQDPANPFVEGELKIPGYSNYLHPIGEHHLLGIGHETAVRGDGKHRFVENLGVKVSLFNVSDPANPIEQDVEVIGSAGTSSSVSYSHKSLYRDVANNRYGFDISVYHDSVFKGVGAAFFNITPAGIDGPQLFIEKTPGEQYEDWNKNVKRILYSNDRTFIISNNHIKAMDRATLQPIEAIDLK